MDYSDRDLWTAIHTLAAAVEYLQLNGTKQKQAELLAKHLPVNPEAVKRTAVSHLTRWFRQIEVALDIPSHGDFEWTRQNTKDLAYNYAGRCIEKTKTNSLNSHKYYTYFDVCRIISSFCDKASDAAFYQEVVSRSRQVDDVLATLSS
jgi:hypothetical protein